MKPGRSQRATTTPMAGTDSKRRSEENTERPQSWQKTRIGFVLLWAGIYGLVFLVNILSLIFRFVAGSGQIYYQQLIAAGIIVAVISLFLALFPPWYWCGSYAMASQGIWLRNLFGKKRFIAWERIVDVKRSSLGIEVKILNSRGKRRSVLMLPPVHNPAGDRPVAERPPEGHSLRKFL